MKGQFILHYNETEKDYSGSEVVEIGKIVDTITDKDVMYIYYERDLYKRQGTHMCIEEYMREDGDYPVAKTDDLHRSCLFKNPEIFLTLMLHELGHFWNGDLDEHRKGEMTSEKIQEDRLRAIIVGKVDSHELKADMFAVKSVGKNTFMRAMDYMINTRKQRGDAGAEFAIKEFELRKKAIKNMK